MKIVCFVFVLLLIHSTTTLSEESTPRKSLIEQFREVEERASSRIKPETFAHTTKQATKDENLKKTSYNEEEKLIQKWDEYIEKRDSHDLKMGKLMMEIRSADFSAEAALPLVEAAKANPSRENISNMVHSLADVLTATKVALKNFHKTEDERNELYDELNTLLLQTRIYYDEKIVANILY